LFFELKLDNYVTYSQFLYFYTTLVHSQFPAFDNLIPKRDNMKGAYPESFLYGFTNYWNYHRDNLTSLTWF